MIIVIGGEKGGTGKTTIATNLAAMRAKEVNDVLLLDTDIQASASYWAKTRDHAKIEPSIFCVQKFGEIDSEVDKFSKKFNDIIIDAGGRDSAELRSSTLIAHKIFVPIQASQFDMWTIKTMDKMMEKAKTFNPNLQSFIVLSRASTNPSISETEEAKELLGDLKELKLLDQIIRERISFRKAAREGLSVSELKTDRKAISEIEKLYKEIYHV